MARETQLWQTLARVRPTFGSMLHIDRVENPATPGTPDVEGHLYGMGQFWFELKSEERPAKSDTPIRFDVRDAQVEWHRKRWNVGGACFWLLQVGSGSQRRVYMLEGPHGAALLRGVPEQYLAEHNVLKGIKFDAAEAIRCAFR